MNRAVTLRKLLLAPAGLRASLIPRTVAFQTSRTYAVQTIAQPSFWKSMIPKPLRKNEGSSVSQKPKLKKDWNPATFFIWIFLLIGSMSIQMIALNKEYTAFSRRADAKIGLLKEIIGKIQKGEDVDVERLLGTGDEKTEREWEEGMLGLIFCLSFFLTQLVVVMQEIEREEEARSQSKQAAEAGQDPEVEDKPATGSQDASQPKFQSNVPRGFY